MKLYYAPGACSLSPHIVLCESGLPFQLERVDLKAKQTESGGDYRAVNPKGYVPALQLDDGNVLTEGPAIVQYIADRVPEKKLAPAAGTLERYRLMEWLNFIATELHKNFGPVFNPNTPDDIKATAKSLLEQRIGFAAAHLEKNDFLLGQMYSVADAYLFTVLGWCKWVGLELSKWPVLKTYTDRIVARPAVHAALVAEKLLKE